MRLPSTLYVLFIASPASCRNTDSTFASLSPILIRSGFAAAKSPDIFPFPASLLYSSTNNEMKSASLFAFLWLASSSAFRKTGSRELLLIERSKLNNSTSSVTFIPPCRSRPRFNSDCLALLYDVHHQVTFSSLVLLSNSFKRDLYNRSKVSWYNARSSASEAYFSWGAG